MQWCVCFWCLAADGLGCVLLRCNACFGIASKCPPFYPLPLKTKGLAELWGRKTFAGRCSEHSSTTGCCIGMQASNSDQHRAGTRDLAKGFHQRIPVLLLPGHGTGARGTEMPQPFVLLLQVQAHGKQRAKSVEEWPGALCEHCRCNIYWEHARFHAHYVSEGDPCGA